VIVALDNNGTTSKIIFRPADVDGLPAPLSPSPPPTCDDTLIHAERWAYATLAEESGLFPRRSPGDNPMDDDNDSETNFEEACAGTLLND
jgi:hypothetical protein